MKSGRKYSKYDIQLISQYAIGKTLKEIMESNITNLEDSDAKNKGSFGQLIETYLFGIENNSDSQPDFVDAGIELKVTPYKKLKNGNLSAKERLVLNIIDYNSEYKNTFESSHFWFKNHAIQILWYLWQNNISSENLTITNEKLLELETNEDLEQIKIDWQTIVDKIKAGKAHEISEADTMYLGACTKGADSSSVRSQPYSDTKAKQRAFCFKTSYMTQLVRKYIGNCSDVEKIIKDSQITFLDFVNKVISKYKNKTQSELMNEFNLESNPKNLFCVLVSRMFNVNSKLEETDEFKKANIIPKTIRVETNGRIKESMSFPAFKFEDIVNIDFEDSNIKDMLETTKYMFFIFKKEGLEYIFKGIKLWNTPQTIIENEVKDVYEKTQEIVKFGNIVNYIDKRNRRITNFPGLTFNGVFHVRPHGRNSKDTYCLPVKDQVTGLTSFTKQCFWFNNTYIKNLIKEFID